ncbi:glutamyl-tRNA reductase [Chromobacterium amazonense]|uniref:Glutamyl-tRNA reductase n=1 Tax=Chromobacterium amazonense TaxID=1382803 RepID=A0ABU8UZK7_9NEIS|nr:glutamyl-tRNA reductase [Chromobacterium amazonense]KIA79620.1 glutamyl-tRNA reductase [Chromobacterium piscinae]MBM2885994.1 glutamyl-tRNA reductase [Chromobacterium amazonense]MDE1713654.1 glutamyl-tRNA reductase [Chromobacterium amazonense]MDQ4540357.1 glutamyl-tRNA reductase [Chromobacterium amazonense]
MHLLALGLNHHTAPLSIREKLAFPAETLPHALDSLVASQAAREAAIVSTCNRTEIYCLSTDPHAALDWLCQFHGLSRAEVEPYLYRLEAAQAARHAFRVASGLDSMVLGETQILGQLKDAVRSAESAGTLGTLLNGLFQRTFAVAKEVRSSTAVGASSVSMSAAAVKLAEQIFPSVAELNVLFVGAGEMIELVATHFAARNPSCITVANRTLERGQRLAEQFGGNAITLAELPEALARYDVVVTSTASQLPIIGKGMVERAIKARRHRPMFMLDLAVPRDIELEVDKLDDVFLFSVDDIAGIVEVGKEARQQAAAEAESIIQSRVAEFNDWLKKRETVPLIRALRDEAERTRRHALEGAMKQLARGDAPEKVLEALSVQLTNKLMHPPTQALSSGSGAEHDAQVQTIARLYRLHPES